MILKPQFSVLNDSFNQKLNYYHYGMLFSIKLLSIYIFNHSHRKSTDQLFSHFLKIWKMNEKKKSQRKRLRPIKIYDYEEKEEKIVAVGLKTRRKLSLMKIIFYK